MADSRTAPAKSAEIEVTVRIRMTAGQVADYANEFGQESLAHAIADVQDRTVNTVTEALKESYWLREFTTVTVTGPR